MSGIFCNHVQVPPCSSNTSAVSTSSGFRMKFSHKKSGPRAAVTKSLPAGHRRWPTTPTPASQRSSSARRSAARQEKACRRWFASKNCTLCSTSRPATDWLAYHDFFGAGSQIKNAAPTSGAGNRRARKTGAKVRAIQEPGLTFATDQRDARKPSPRLFILNSHLLLGALKRLTFHPHPLPRPQGKGNKRKSKVNSFFALSNI